MSTAVVAWTGAITGVAGLLIKGVEFIRSFGAERRDGQRELRSDLRTALEDAKKQMRLLDYPLHHGNDVPEEGPDRLGATEDQLEGLRRRLARPAPTAIMLAGLAIRKLAYSWKELLHSQKMLKMAADHDEQLHRYQRQLYATTDNAKKAFAEANPAIESILKELDRMDRGR